jgi:hypothetical protein
MEAIVRNNRLRMVRGVGVAGNGACLRNDQTTERDSIAPMEGEGGVLLFTDQGFRIRDCVAKWTWVMSRNFRETVRGFHDLLRQKPPSQLIL